MKKRYYLAYGSNLNIEQMRYRCPSARVIGTATIDNYQLLFKGSKTGAYLTIEPAEGESVPVGVWSVGEEDELRLDRYEGYPRFYYKKEIEVPIISARWGKIHVCPAFVYIMHEDRPRGVPTISYMRTCLTGYDVFGFDRKKLFHAYIKSKRMDLM